MGNSGSVQHKNSYAARREHYADDYPVYANDELEFVTVNVDELFSTDPQKLKEMGDIIVQGLSRDNILILRNTPETFAKVQAAYEEAKEFLKLSEVEKKRFGLGEAPSFNRKQHSGYSLIHFTNESNRRDEEYRDVYQIRYSEDKDIPWPSDSFKSASQDLYDLQWKICVQALNAIALSLGVQPDDLFKLAASSSDLSSDLPDPHKSQNTNLCYFHYFDKNQSYKTLQKCMVHEDHGLLTILPKSDLPGLELLHPKLEQWVPMEQFVENNEMLFYCGLALQIVTDSHVLPAKHRVVRVPKKERFSMPFEMKPDNDAVLQNLLTPEKDPITFERLEKRLSWERVVTSVNRADGIEPGSEEEKEWKANLQKEKEEHATQLQLAQTEIKTEA